MSDFDLELQTAFLEEATQLVADAEQCFLNLERSAEDPAIIDQIFRLAHNLKGSARAVGFAGLAEFTHAFESYLLQIKKKERAITPDVVTLLLACNDRISVLLKELRQDPRSTHDCSDLITALKASPADAQGESLAAMVRESLPPSQDPKPSHEPATSPELQPSPEPSPMAAAPAAEIPAPTPAPAPAPVDDTLRVNLSRIENLVNAVGELVIIETVLSQNKDLMPNPLLVKTVTQLDKIAREIRDLSLSLRMTKVKPVFLKLQRIVRDTSAALGKNIQLELRGEDTEIDKTVLDQLNDPLVHLIRNAVDHGIEPTPDRVLAGKPPEGHVKIAAYQRGDRIMIDITDDGKGLDARKLTEKAIEKGILPEGTTLSDEEAYNLIFAAGFSTKAVTTDISGRGVGMDVVRTNITRLKGTVQILTELGKGTTFRVSLPLTMSIIDGMVIRVATEHFVVPLSNVNESYRPKPGEMGSIAGRGEYLNLRGETMPLHRLGHLLGMPATKPVSGNGIAIVVRGEESPPFSLYVDDILAKQQVVIRPLGPELRGRRGIAAGAILGDGRAALILDFTSIVETRNAA